MKTFKKLIIYRKLTERNLLGQEDLISLKSLLLVNAYSKWNKDWENSHCLTLDPCLDPTSVYFVSCANKRDRISLKFHGKRFKYYPGWFAYRDKSPCLSLLSLMQVTFYTFYPNSSKLSSSKPFFLQTMHIKTQNTEDTSEKVFEGSFGVLLKVLTQFTLHTVPRNTVYSNEVKFYENFIKFGYVFGEIYLFKNRQKTFFNNQAVTFHHISIHETLTKNVLKEWSLILMLQKYLSLVTSELKLSNHFCIICHFWALFICTDNVL